MQEIQANSWRRLSKKNESTSVLLAEFTSLINLRWLNRVMIYHVPHASVFAFILTPSPLKLIKVIH